VTATFSKVKRGRRPSHDSFGPAATLAQLEASTRAVYRGIPVVPAGAPIWDWRVCGCDYATPTVDGKPVRQADDPAYAEWSEQPAEGRTPLARVVRELVLVYGLGYFDAKDAFRGFPGWPDVTIWSAGRWVAGVQIGAYPRRLVRELKGMTTQIYAQQLATLTTLRLAGDDVGVWKPCCLLSGRISAELMALAGVIEPHSDDRYAVLCARTAESGRLLLPGTVPADPPPAPKAARVSRKKAAAPAPAADLLADLVTGGATGYVLNPGGTVDELTAKTLGRLRAWAVDYGVERADLMWPWRLIVTDTRYYLQVRAGAGRRWHEVSRLPASPTNVVDLVESLNPRRLHVADVATCMRLITSGPAPATRGDTL
jgi:hypothetical protein